MHNWIDISKWECLNGGIVMDWGSGVCFEVPQLVHDETLM